MKKSILIIVAIGLIFAPTMVGATLRIAINISSCVCSGNPNAFKRGCDYYINARINGKKPDQAETEGEQRCENYYTQGNPVKLNKCKSLGVMRYLSKKDQDELRI